MSLFAYQSSSMLFDEVFDDPSSEIICAQTNPEHDKDIAPAAAEQKTSKVTQTDLDVLRREAFEAGMLQGRSERADIEHHKISQIVDRIANPIEQALNNQNELAAIFLGQLYDISKSALNIILPALLKKYGMRELAEFLDALEPIVNSARKIEIFANSDTCDAIRQQIGNQAAANVSWQISTSSEDGDVRLAWSKGSAERNACEFLRELEKLLDPACANYP